MCDRLLYVFWDSEYFPGYTADLHRNTTGWNPHGFYLKRLENNVFSEKQIERSWQYALVNV